MPEEEYLSKDKKEKLPRIEKFKLIMEYAKWFVVSVVLVVVALIIDSGFKSREQGLKEVTEYDKYIEILVYNDNVGAKVKLAEFLSIISTSDDIRERWEIYHKKVKAEYEEFEKMNAEKEAKLEVLKQKEIKKTLTDEDVIKLNKLKKEKNDIESQLSEEIKLPPKITEGNVIKETIKEESPIEGGTGVKKRETPIRKEIIK